MRSVILGLFIFNKIERRDRAERAESGRKRSAATGYGTSALGQIKPVGLRHYVAWAEIFNGLSNGPYFDSTGERRNGGFVHKYHYQCCNLGAILRVEVVVTIKKLVVTLLISGLKRLAPKLGSCTAPHLHPPKPPLASFPPPPVASARQEGVANA